MFSGTCHRTLCRHAAGSGVLLCATPDANLQAHPSDAAAMSKPSTEIPVQGLSGRHSNHPARAGGASAVLLMSRNVISRTDGVSTAEVGRCSAVQLAQAAAE